MSLYPEDGSPMVPAYCPGCGEPNPTRVRFCPACGRDTVETDQTMGLEVARPCGACGALVTVGAEHCPSCGAVPGEAPAPIRPSAPDIRTSFDDVGTDATVARGSLVVTMPDGAPGPTFPLGLSGTMTLGRTEGLLTFEEDRYMSPEHLELEGTPQGVIVRDLGTLNGTYVRLKEPTVVADGGLVIVGQQLLRVRRAEPAPPFVDPSDTIFFGSAARAVLWVVDQVTRSRNIREVHAVTPPGCIVGRHHADIHFPYDTSVSSQHTRLEPTDHGVRVVDLDSSNGTWIRMAEPVRVRDDGDFLIGQVKVSIRLPQL